MVEQYLKYLKKKLGINKKRITLEDILKEYEVDINEPSDSGQCLLHSLISDAEEHLLELVLNLPSDFKTQTKADPNIIDKKYNWTPLVMAIN